MYTSGKAAEVTMGVAQAAKMANQWPTEIILQSINNSKLKLQYYYKH